MQEEAIRLWFPMAVFVAMPLLTSVLPAQLLRFCKGKYIFLLVVCFFLGLVITSNAYHVRNAYLGLPQPWSWGVFVFGLIWSLSFYIPSWVLMVSLSGEEKQELRYKLLKGVLGSLVSVVFIAVPSVFLIVLFSLE